MRFTTYSGSEYEIEGDWILRINQTAGKRADGEWVRLVNSPIIEVGQSAVLTMLSLSSYGTDDYETRPEDASPYTTRITSTVMEVSE